MPTDRPTAAELIEAVRAFLANEVAPRLDGRVAFHLRVAGTALAVVQRELAEGAAVAEAERARLAALLGRDGEAGALNAALAAALREGRFEGDRAALLAHLRESARERLRLANPRYLERAEAAARSRAG